MKKYTIEDFKKLVKEKHPNSKNVKYYIPQKPGEKIIAQCSDKKEGWIFIGFDYLELKI